MADQHKTTVNNHFEKGGFTEGDKQKNDVISDSIFEYIDKVGAKVEHFSVETHLGSVKIALHAEGKGQAGAQLRECSIRQVKNFGRKWALHGVQVEIAGAQFPFTWRAC